MTDGLMGHIEFTFLLTRPSRDVTSGNVGGILAGIDFYSHVPRGT